MEITSVHNHLKASQMAPERLANNHSLSESEKIAEASRQFEALLLRQILETTQKTVIKSKFADDSAAGSIYRDMITNELAESISKSGTFGLAKSFEQQLTMPKHKEHLEGSSKHQDSSSKEAPNTKHAMMRAQGSKPAM